MINTAKNLLASYVDALYPIIYINHFDFHFIDGIISEIADGVEVTEFINGLGCINFSTKSPVYYYNKLADYLYAVKDDGYDRPQFIVLKDVHNQLDDPEVVSLLKYISEKNMYNDAYNATIFIVSSKLHIPGELEDMITVYDVPLPKIDEIKAVINEFVTDIEIEVSDDIIGEIAQSFKGMNEFQIKQILNLAYQESGSLTEDDKQLILKQKEQLIKKAGLLEILTVNESIDDIGGLENLKEWLYKKEVIFSQIDKAAQFGVDIPKGIMIVGMPGCGKSMAAKATARLFEVPLVRLDVGRLLGKYVGESEDNMRRALKLSEAISPCVLWIDEIEKAFSGVGASGGGSDVTTRLFGQFLTWMQEKDSSVFIVATANDISRIPPEFLRKGRFDELFYVDFPNKVERKKILEIHLIKRKKWNKDIDIISIVKDTEGYNGADLESIVKEAVETCFIEDRDKVTTEDLKNAKANIKSISVTLEKRIREIKETTKDMDLKPASAGENEDKIAQRPQKNNNPVAPIGDKFIKATTGAVAGYMKASVSMYQDILGIFSTNEEERDWKENE